MGTLALTKVVRNFDIFQLPVNADFSVDRDAEGNLWLARSVRSPKDEDVNIGIELYKLDRDTATQFVIEGDEAPEINFTYHVAVDAEGTAWLFREFDSAPAEPPLFGIDRNNKWVGKPSQQWKGRVTVDGKPCFIRSEGGDKYTIVAQSTNKKLASFKTTRSCKIVSTADHIFSYNSYFIDIRSSDGTLIRTFDWDSAAKLDPLFAGKAFDFLTPTPLDSRSLLVPFGSRHSETDVTLYVLGIDDNSFRPSPLDGALKARPSKCLFDRNGRLWAAHHHSPAYGFSTTSFSVVDTDRKLTTFGGKKKKENKVTKKEARAMIARKREIALAALDNHARRYKVKIPERLRAFYAGDFDRHDMTYVTASVLSWGKGTFQLALTPPTWLEKGDDAVSGPRGDWDGAKYHVPLFVTDLSLYLVVNFEDPTCPTGWYHEEECSDSGPGKGAPSLDAFLASLTRKPKGEVTEAADPEQQDHWEQDFSDDSPRVFDAVHDDDDDD